MAKTHGRKRGTVLKRDQTRRRQYEGFGVPIQNSVTILVRVDLCTAKSRVWFERYSEKGGAFSGHLSHQTLDFAVQRSTSARMANSESPQSPTDARNFVRGGGPRRIPNRHPQTFVLSSSRLVQCRRNAETSRILRCFFCPNPKLH